jgi:serine/threonine-protein kinase
MGRVTPLVPPPHAASGSTPSGRAPDLVLDETRTLTIGAQIGRGSMATVYRAILNGAYGVRREVALKLFDVIASDECDDVMSMVASAARDAACVRHPNVVELYDFGLASPVQPFFLVELVEGRTLAALLDATRRAHARVAPDLALFIGIEIAEALTGARTASRPDGMRLNLTHGELATCDVMLSLDGEVKVTDFGLAAASRAASVVRSVGSLARRMAALAPEVARGGVGDARSDVFSLGVLLREMLLGPRFPATIGDARVMQLARDGVVVGGVFEPQIAPELRLLIDRAIDRDPARRFPHARALGDELRHIALAMGVGDGRAFLRHALPHAFDDDERTGEHDAHVHVSAPSYPEPDRFARLRGLPESGTFGVADDAADADEESGTSD